MYYYYAVFGGFENSMSNTTQIPTAEQGAVSLRCDYLDAIPVPVVEWYMNDDLIQESSSIRYVNNGQYLYIAALTADQRTAQYHCVVTNHGNSQRAPTTYSLASSITADELIVYKELEPFTVELPPGSSVNVQYAAAYRSSGASTGTLLSAICNAPAPVVYSGNGLIGTVSGFSTAGVVEIPCSIIGSINGAGFFYEIIVTGESLRLL